MQNPIDVEGIQPHIMVVLGGNRSGDERMMFCPVCGAPLIKLAREIEKLIQGGPPQGENGYVLQAQCQGNRPSSFHKGYRTKCKAQYSFFV